MLTALVLAMILVFIILLAKKKISVFAALTLIPLFFGCLAVLVTDHTVMDLFNWIKAGTKLSSSSLLHGTRCELLAAGALCS